MKNLPINEVLEKHDKLREILIEYGNEEFGDCIIDEISKLFNFPTTIDIDNDDEDEDYQSGLLYGVDNKQ